MKTLMYADKIYDIAVETFELMCYMFPLDESEVTTQQPVPGSDAVTAAVRFDGAAEGGMSLRTSQSLMEAIANNMLGTDNASRDQKHGALCEMANIICGNIVPFFNKDRQICYIRPPFIASPDQDPEEMFRGKQREEVTIHLDEGTAEIIVYYS